MTSSGLWFLSFDVLCPEKKMYGSKSAYSNTFYLVKILHSALWQKIIA